MEGDEAAAVHLCAADPDGAVREPDRSDQSGSDGLACTLSPVPRSRSQPNSIIFLA